MRSGGGEGGQSSCVFKIQMTGCPYRTDKGCVIKRRVGTGTMLFGPKELEA